MSNQNLICLFGPSGSGKTRLLRAMEEALGNEGALRIGAEGMIQEMIDSLRFEGMAAYRRKYLGLDTLLVDNLWVVEDKPVTASEICRILSERAEVGRLTVLASDLSQSEWRERNMAVGEFLAESEAVMLGDIGSEASVQAAEK